MPWLARSLLLTLALGGAGASLGCEASPRPLSWTIRFSTPDLAARAAVVDARILRESCTGEEIWGIEIREGDSMTPRPPSLVPGRYCFVASAQDVDCVRYAESTVMVDLPGETEVINTLIARAPQQICIPPMCRSGGCRPPDAGIPDTGMDAPRADVPGLDAPGLDAPAPDVPDAPVIGPPDTPPDTSCSASETDCGNLRDDDCDGSTDCADGECSGMPSCDACMGVMCPECQTCVGGACMNVGEGNLCAGGACRGGTCCRGCWNGSTCAGGLTVDTECGMGGAVCTSCGTCTECRSGACLPQGDGTPCAGGRCLAGACCAGCSSAGSCVAGDQRNACGAGGLACMDCGECGRCVGGGCIPERPLTSCGGGSGTCAGSTCCTGCVDAGSGACQSGVSTGACGFGGNRCNTSCTCSGGICAMLGGERCDSPLDVSAGGEFPVDTCAYSDDVALTCNAPGTRDVVIRGSNPGTYTITVSSGFVINYVPFPVVSCVPDMSCNPGMHGSSGATPDGFFMWVIERQGGGCGRVHIRVTRS